MSQYKLLALALFVSSAITCALRADIVYVASTPPGCTNTAACGNLNTNGYIENGFGSYTSAKSSAPDAPIRPGSRYFSNSFSNSTPQFGVTLCPVLPRTGEVYRVEHTFSAAAGNVSPDVIVGLTNLSGCTLSFTNTTRFQSIYGNSQWQVLGFLTNNALPGPVQITLYFVGGTVSAGAQKRLLLDCFRFTAYCCCLQTPSPVVTGPVATNLDTVWVSGIWSNASMVNLYHGRGFLTNLASFTLSNPPPRMAFPVQGLARGAQLAATQVVGGSESCKPTAGVVVGGGANPPLRLALSVRETPAAMGPVGANGSAFMTSPSRLHFLGASSLNPRGGPADGLILYPSNEWQTVTLQRGPDYRYPTNVSVLWSPGSAGEAPATNELHGSWAVLDGLALALQDTNDVGPFEVYLDSFENGAEVLEDFEAASPGIGYMFNTPEYSGTTAGMLLSDPNESTVVAGVADGGRHGCQVKFQFNAADPGCWLRLTTFNALGRPNPMVNLDEPVRFRVLVLPSSRARGCSGCERPSLRFRRAGSDIILEWSSAGVLQSAPLSEGPFTNILGATSPFTNCAAGQRFFRLRELW